MIKLSNNHCRLSMSMRNTERTYYEKKSKINRRNTKISCRKNHKNSNISRHKEKKNNFRKNGRDSSKRDEKLERRIRLWWKGEWITMNDQKFDSNLKLDRQKKWYKNNGNTNKTSSKNGNKEK